MSTVTYDYNFEDGSITRFSESNQKTFTERYIWERAIVVGDGDVAFSFTGMTPILILVETDGSVTLKATGVTTEVNSIFVIDFNSTPYTSLTLANASATAVNVKITVWGE